MAKAAARGRHHRVPSFSTTMAEARKSAAKDKSVHDAEVEAKTREFEVVYHVIIVAERTNKNQLDMFEGKDAEG